MLLVFDRIDPDAVFRVCVQFGQFTAKLDDGTCVHVPRKCLEWVVDYQQCTLESLEKDLAARVTWGKCQQVVMSGYDMTTGEETPFKDNMDVVHALFVRKSDKKLFRYADVEDKHDQLVTDSFVSEVNELFMDEVVTARHGDESNNLPDIDWDGLEIAQIPQEQVHHQVIDWDGLEIAPILEADVGSSVPLMGEDDMYAFVGLRAEDERAEQARLQAENQRDSAPNPAADVAQGDLNLNEAEIDVNDVVPGEAGVFYDRDDPPMEVGSLYMSMVEFRSAVRQHDIKGQFELGTEKIDTERFRGYCTAEGCPWAIVARLQPDGKSVKVLTTNLAWLCYIFNILFLSDNYKIIHFDHALCSFVL